MNYCASCKFGEDVVVVDQKGRRWARKRCRLTGEIHSCWDSCDRFEQAPPLPEVEHITLPNAKGGPDGGMGHGYLRFRRARAGY